MTPARQRLTEARIKRALAAWLAAGQQLGGLEVAPDGTVRILASAPPKAPDDAMDAWLARRGNGDRDEGAA